MHQAKYPLLTPLSRASARGATWCGATRSTGGGRIKKSSFKVLNILGVDGLNAVKDFVESIYKGSTMVLIKDENFDLAVAALRSVSCDFQELPRMEYEEAVANFERINAENEARRIASELKAEAIENFGFETWKEQVAAILVSNVTTADGPLRLKIEEFYKLVETVTGEKFRWTADDADVVFSHEPKRGRRHIVNLAFKVVIPLVRKHLTELKLGDEREAKLLALLSTILFPGN